MQENQIVEYLDFQKRFKLLVSKHPELIINTLSNIFTMRLIGNKTHGDLAEIGLVEFINQFMYDFSSTHVGKDLFRAKEHEEDILIKNELNESEFPLSLKAYGNGPLQLSTDRDWLMYPYLEKFRKDEITDREIIREVFNCEEFQSFSFINVMPLIYNEAEKKCNIMVFDNIKARNNVSIIKKINPQGRRKHPIYSFLDENKNYIFEIRYGNAAANALQRGLWTHTKKALPYFDSLTNGWIDYSHNLTLVKTFSLALVSTEKTHEKANKLFEKDIDKQRRK